jgi:DNA repair protein RadC
MELLSGQGKPSLTFYLTGFRFPSIINNIVHWSVILPLQEAHMADESRKTVKHWPKDERPRERLIAHGPASLSDAQLLAIIIKNGKAGRTAIDLAMELLVKFENLTGIEQAGINEICEVPGIGKAKASQLKAAIEIGRRYQKPSLAGASFCSSHDVAAYYQPRMKGLKKEIFQCVVLDTKNKISKIIKDEEISVGSLSASLVHPRETFKAAIRESAAAVIFIHNHPSGDIRPSQEDILLTRRLVQAGEVIGIQVLDHIIIGDGDHFSFRDNGMIAPALS